MRVPLDGASLILVLCLCWWTASAEPPADARAAAAPADVKRVLGMLEERMSTVQTLKSGFVQEKRLAVLQQPLVLRGIIYMEKPALFAWHVTEPVRYSMVIRDDVVRQWDEDTQRVQRIALSKNPPFKMVLRQMKGWFSGAYKSMLGEYEITVLDEAPVTLEFIPREGSFAEAAIESVTVFFGSDERYIREMRIAEKGGDSTLLTFADTQLNAPLDPSAWQVEPRVR